MCLVGDYNLSLSSALYLLYAPRSELPLRRMVCHTVYHIDCPSVCPTPFATEGSSTSLPPLQGNTNHGARNYDGGVFVSPLRPSDTPVALPKLAMEKVAKDCGVPFLISIPPFNETRTGATDWVKDEGADLSAPLG